MARERRSAGGTESDPGLRAYLGSIQRYPTLDREQEVALARRYRAAGDAAAGHALVTANLRFVVTIASGFRGYGFRLADLVEEGNLGLLEAVRRFDPERGLRFMTYATYWVRAFILAYVLKSWSLVGVGTGPLQSKLFFRLQRERARVVASGSSAADADRELATTFGTTEDRIRDMQGRLDGRDQSLDAQVFRDGAITALDLLADEQPSAEVGLARAELDQLVRERLGRVMRSLDPRETYIAQSRLLADEPRTLAAVGDVLGLSRERVRQIEVRLKAKLRRAFDDVPHDEEQAVA
jgi:RNA polymerase sigma-32 factor